MSVFFNPQGAPELACDNCGSRWYDRMNNCCYECGQPVTDEMIVEFNKALADFNERRQAARTGSSMPPCLPGRAVGR